MPQRIDPNRPDLDPMGDQDQKPLMNKNLFLWIGVFVGFMLISHFTGPGAKDGKITYSQFKELVEQGHVEKVTISQELIKGSLEKGNPKFFKVTKPGIEDKDLIGLLESKGVVIDGDSDSPNLFTAMLINLLPWVLIFGFFFWSSKRLREGKGGMGGGMPPFLNKADAGVEVTESPMKFSDVAGVENAKRDLEEVVDFLKTPDKFQRLGATLPRGVLMMGPPGTGKTLLAKATAGEAEVPFFSLSGSEFIELYVGMGASRVRNLFDKAKKKAPSIIFIDEIDSIGRSRGTGLGGGHDEREQTLNQILAEMDGFGSDNPVVVLAATNRPDVLDSALTRPGRFDRQVVLDLPLVGAREKILNIHIRNVPLSEDVNLIDLAKTTAGFSGADLKNLVNEAALFAARRNGDKVTLEDFGQARDKVLMGNPREEMLVEKQKETIAVHEAGHAIVAILTPGTDQVNKITIVPRGRALGFTEQVSSEDKVNLTKEQLEAQLAILLGGRIAEEIVFNKITTGAESDLKRATQMARRMIVNWGMGKNLGYLAFEQGEEHAFLGREISRPKNFSEKTCELIDAEIKEMLGERANYVRDLITNNKEKLLALSGALMDKETLTQKEIEDLV